MRGRGAHIVRCSSRLCGYGAPRQADAQARLLPCAKETPKHVYKIKHQLAGWKRFRMTAVLRGGQRTIRSFLSAAPPPYNVVVTRTTATAPLTAHR